MVALLGFDERIMGVEIQKAFVEQGYGMFNLLLRDARVFGKFAGLAYDAFLGGGDVVEGYAGYLKIGLHASLATCWPGGVAALKFRQGRCQGCRVGAAQCIGRKPDGRSTGRLTGKTQLGGVRKMYACGKGYLLKGALMLTGCFVATANHGV